MTRVPREVRLFDVWCSMCPGWEKLAVEESRVAAIAERHAKRNPSCLVHVHHVATVMR